MGEKCLSILFSEIKKTHCYKNSSFTTQKDYHPISYPNRCAAGHLLSTEQKVGKDSPKRGEPLFGITPLGAVLRTQSVEAGKVEKVNVLNFQAHTWADAADASLVFIAVYIGTIVTRGSSEVRPVY